MRVVEKKIKPRFYAEVAAGQKNFELRRDEDDIKPGDMLRLKAWDGERYLSKPPIDREVMYVLREYEGLQEGYCIIGF